MNYAYKMIISYDGTQYQGWQEQPGKHTICGALKSAFKRAFHTIDCQIVGASRTDAGVHALGQVAVLHTSICIEGKKLQWILNNALSEDIIIRDMHSITTEFHPRYTVEKKIYYYHIFPTRPFPFLARYGWFCSQPFDQRILQKALDIFVGEHNFAAFRAADDERKNTIKTIDSIDFCYIKRYNVYQIQVVGQSFMRHMIRRIVGAAVTVAIKSNNFNTQIICDLLRSGNPNHPLKNAPSKGLLLKKIIYKNKLNL